jgi:hypothetical protein
MNTTLATGLFVMASAAIYLVNIAWRKGERFEYASALFFGEWGLMLVAGERVRAETGSEMLGVGVAIAFGLSMLSTAIVWWKLFQRYKRDARK